MGANPIDTAAAYGSGRSEEVVARALENLSASLCVHQMRPQGGRARERVSIIEIGLIRRECENSLHRLRVEAIDLYQIHWPVADSESARRRMGDARPARARGEGPLDRRFQLRCAADALAQQIAPITSLQPPYSWIRREIEQEVLPFCLEEGIGVIVYSPMASGLLTGAMTRERVASLGADDWRSRDPEFQGPRLFRNLELVDRMRGRSAHATAICRDRWRSPGPCGIRPSRAPSSGLATQDKPRRSWPHPGSD